MTVDYERQLRWPTDEETAANDGLNLAALREFATAVNNFKSKLAGPKVADLIQTGTPTFQSADSTVDETLIHQFAPRRVPHGFNRLHWQIGGYMNAAPGGQTCAITLYCGPKAYDGPTAPFDATFLGHDSASSAITLSSTTEEFPAGKTDLDIVRSPSGHVWLCVAATNSHATGGHYAFLTALAATCKVDVI